MIAEQTNTEIITLTPAAAQAVRDLLAARNLEGYALRVYVSGGGCSGLQYGMALEGKIREQDQVADFEGVKVVVDEISINYLRGSTIDYIEDVTGGGFKIENPNPMPTCGCSSAEASAGGCSGCG
ncbi:MAG: iron-sulfur cluster assembly accessory protein [Anaerolineales bacterium]|nr:iron-sulfur cluster assembly accessory protein [Anaerolineales bacterium]